VEEEEADRYLRCIKPAGREEKEEPHCRLLYLSEKWPTVFQRGEREREGCSRG